MDCQSEDDDTINHHAYEEPQQERQERHPPDRYGEWVYIAQEEDPVTVKEALKHLNYLQEEAIGSKWVFKQKHDAGNVERSG